MEDIDLGSRAELEYAGFWSRVAALIVDDAILIVLGLALLIGAASVGVELVVVANFVFMLVAFFYWPVLESMEHRATLGKQLLGIQVTDMNGARLSFVRSLLRNLAKILSSLPFGLGFLLAAFTPKKQALHDLITKCLVVRAGPSNLRKAVIYVVGALVVLIAGSYYYITEIYLPQMMQDMEQQMKQAQKGMPARPAPGKPPVATAPAPTPAPAPAAQGDAKPMTPQEIAEFEKKLAEAKPEPAKVAQATPPAPAKPAPAAREAAPKPAPAPAKPEAAPVAKEAPTKVAAAPAAKPKPEAKPAAVAVAKPKPVPAPPPVALVTEPPAPPPAQPAEPRAPAAPVAAPAPAPAAAPVAAAPPSRPARSPRFNDVMTAVMFRDAAAVSELLELGWWVDRPDSNGLTPLMAAAWNGDGAMAQILLKAGANPNAHARGGSVLDYAGRGEDARVIELLRNSGAR